MEKEILIERVRQLTTPHSLVCLLNDMKAEYNDAEDYPFHYYLLEYFSNTTKIGVIIRSLFKRKMVVAVLSQPREVI